MYMIGSFDGSMFNGKIIIGKADKKQNNLLEMFYNLIIKSTKIKSG